MSPELELSAEQFQNFRTWIAGKNNVEQRTIPESAFDITTLYDIDGKLLALRYQQTARTGPLRTVVGYESRHTLSYSSAHTKELRSAKVISKVERKQK